LDVPFEDLLPALFAGTTDEDGLVLNNGGTLGNLDSMEYFPPISKRATSHWFKVRTTEDKGPE